MTPRVAARDTAGVAKRNLLRIIRTPRLLVIGAIQPAMLLILFRYVLGGAIHIPGGNYVDYVVPAIFLEAVLIGGMTTSIGLAEDLKSGIIDRFRSLPMARSAVLAGRTLADLSRSLLSLAIMVVLGLLVGFRFHSDAGSILAGLAADHGLRLRVLLDVRRDRARDQRPRDRPGRRHPPVLHPDVRQQRDRPGRHDAQLASRLRQQPAPQRHRRRRPRAARRRPRSAATSGSRSPGPPASSSSSSRSPCTSTATPPPNPKLPVGLREWSRAVENAIHRIIQAALTNAATHAQARRPGIEARDTTRTVELTVRDDGNGFDPTASTAGF